MKPTERFSNRVQNYVRYRPDYPREIMDFMRNEMFLPKKALIADVGCGTGIFAKLLLENGNTVFGVEPNQAMRLASEESLKDFQNYFPIDGTSENTTLSDNSVDFITAAQAFHWFDKEKTLLEFRRILRSKGFVLLIWNDRQLDSNDFLRDYESFLKKFGSDYQKVNHQNLKDQDFGSFFSHGYLLKAFQNAQELDFEGLKGRVLSSSYMPERESENYEIMLHELKTLFANYQKANKIKILYTTKIYYGLI